MKFQIRLELGRLASIAFQRRLCVGGTKDEYILLSEILESAANTVQTALASPVLSRELDGAQLQSLCEFLEVANSTAPKIPFDDGSVSVEDLIETNPAWNMVRVSAQKCLDALGLRIKLEELLERS